jgi:hypothetical protein
VAFTLSALQKAAFNISYIYVSISASFKQNLMQTYCSFKSAIFKVHKNSKWNNTHLYLRYYATTTCATALF